MTFKESLTAWITIHLNTSCEKVVSSKKEEKIILHHHGDHKSINRKKTLYKPDLVGFRLYCDKIGLTKFGSL